MEGKSNSTPWASRFTVQFDPYSGYVKDENDADKLIKEYEVATTTRFTVFKQTAGFSKSDIKENREENSKNHRIQWADSQKTAGCKLSFDGIPFQIAGVKILECQNGPDRNKALKKKEAQKRQQKDEGSTDHSYNNIKRHFIVQDTKKCDCPAKIHLRKIIKYTENKILENTKSRRETMSKVLRTSLSGETQTGTVHAEQRIYISLPKPEDHSFHPMGKVAGLLQPIDDRLIKKIHELVACGVNRVSEMERHLTHYVKRELFAGQPPPQATSRRFFPTNMDVRNHMYRATVLCRHSKIDQENLEIKIKEWQEESPEDNFFFRPYCETSESWREQPQSQNRDECDMEEISNCDSDVIQITDHQSNSLLLVHQTKWQRELLEKYGSEICLLDATYKTSRYALPTFFLCVQTNVDYCIVASFVVQQENANAILEALQVIRNWNACWDPAFFMVDFSEAEINAIERLFPGCLVYICDFHREQAWVRWTNNSKNGISKEDKENLLNRLRTLAKAPTDKEFKLALENLQSSDLWKRHKRLQNWINTIWPSEQKRWVRAYRKDRFNVKLNTNNGVECQNRSFKYQFLADNRDKTLSGIINVLVTQFMPSVYRKYIESNMRYSSAYRQYNASLPKWLHNRPRQFVNHCRLRLVPAEAIVKENICQESDGHFMVTSQSDSTQSYRVQFGDSNTMPSCTCPDWQRHHWPCKHFLAIFHHFPDWGWEAMSPSYNSSPYFQIDSKIITSVSSQNIEQPGCLSAAEQHLENEKDEGGLEKCPAESLVASAENSIAHPGVEKQEGASEKIATSPSFIQNAARCCRELLKEIQDLTYLCADIGAIQSLQQDLQKALSNFQPLVPSENGIFMEVAKPKKKFMAKSKKPLSTGPPHKSPKEYARLPLPLKLKRKNNQPIQVPSQVKKKSKITVPVQYKHNIPSAHFSTILIEETSPDENENEEKTEERLIIKHGKERMAESNPVQDHSHACSSTSSNQPTPILIDETSLDENEEKTEEKLIIKHGEKRMAESNPVQDHSHACSTTSSNQPTPMLVDETSLDENENEEKTEEKLIIKHGEKRMPESNAVQDYSHACSTTSSNQPTPMLIDKTSLNGNENEEKTEEKLIIKHGKERIAESNAVQGYSHVCSTTSSNQPTPILIDETSPDPQSWVEIQSPDDLASKFILYQDSKDRILKKTSWLCDSEIHAGQILLKTKFPFVDGLRDPAVVGPLVTRPAVSEFVQIANTGSHWVCLSTISCSPGTVKVYDSLYQNVSQTAINHSCHLLLHTGDKVTFINERVQKQISHNDCGLFALAFATDLCHGIDPATQCYDQFKMRAHYVSCLDSRDMVTFPRTTKRVQYHPSTKRKTVAIYCTCRMPYDKTEYVQCSKCNAWYHPTCLVIPKWAINTNRRWRCNTCKDMSARKPNLYSSDNKK